MLSNVYPAEEKNEKFVFKYFAYSGTSNSNTGEAASTLKEESLLKTGGTLGAPEAKKVAAVQVTFNVGPQSKTELKTGSTLEKGTLAEFSSVATLSFMSPDSEASIVQGPCE